METKPLQFIKRGEVVSLGSISPTRTLLQVLREDMHCTGTKEGCNEGDCGACTVVLGEARDGRITYSAVNSCIRLAHSVDGLSLWTVEDLALADGTLHPVQQALVQCHGSQCGFCTPGFAMSLFNMYQNHVLEGDTITRELAQAQLSGNLCRCTGYRSILDAAQTMTLFQTAHVDEANLLQKLEQLDQSKRWQDKNSSYISPTSLPDLLNARLSNPKAQIVAGCTDVGLWINKMHMQFEQVLDVTRVHELRQIEVYPQHIAIGSAATLSDAFAALIKDRPQLQTFVNRFAGLPVRNSGTLGGNVANGSPIGDSMPLLIALGANVVLMSHRGHREIPLEQLYTGYRSNVMAADEVLAWIKVPKPVKSEFLRVYKISKRFDDDISAVCLAINLQLIGNKVGSVSIGVGGVAATPVRAIQTETLLTGENWTQNAVKQAMIALRHEFSPISDMRASSSYRLQVLGNLLQRFWLENQGERNLNLESFTLEGEKA